MYHGPTDSISCLTILWFWCTAFPLPDISDCVWGFHMVKQTRCWLALQTPQRWWVRMWAVGRVVTLFLLFQTFRQITDHLQLHFGSTLERKKNPSTSYFLCVLCWLLGHAFPCSCHVIHPHISWLSGNAVVVVVQSISEGDQFEPFMMVSTKYVTFTNHTWGLVWPAGSLASHYAISNVTPHTIIQVYPLLFPSKSICSFVEGCSSICFERKLHFIFLGKYTVLLDAGAVRHAMLAKFSRS